MTNTTKMEFSLERDPRGLLLVTDAAGGRHENIEPIRAFPISDPEHWISLCDPNGREIVQIRDLNELPTDQRELLLSELTRREFVPVIRRISSTPGGREASRASAGDKR